MVETLYRGSLYRAHGSRYPTARFHLNTTPHAPVPMGRTESRSRPSSDSQSDVSATSSPPPYEVHIPPQVRAVLDKAPRRSRLALERKLQDAARLAAMRQWVHESEGQHPIRLQLAGYEGTYSLDPRTRQLTLWDLARR